MYLQWKRVDPITRKVLKLFFIGSGVKFVGYVFVTAGIFMGLADKQKGLQMICLGIVAIAIGWGIIYKAYKLSKS